LRSLCSSSSLVLALALVFTMGLVISAPVYASDEDEPPPFKVATFDIVDLAFDELPWTSEAPRGPEPNPPTDERGVPLFRWRLDGELYYRPGGLAINGMKRIDAYRDTGARAQLDQALLQARALRRISIKQDDAWWLPFWFDYPPEGLKAPWFNAMAQGLALSFYVRLHRVTGDEAWLTAAERTFETFRRLGSKRSQRGRPWVSFVANGGYLWLEHYPNRTPDHVLNAHLHAVIGLYEFWQHTRSDDARALLEGSLTTIRDQGFRYRKEGAISRYGLRSRSNILKYHEIHVWQLRLLGRMTGDATFTELAEQLAADRAPAGYVPGRPAVRERFRPFASVEQARRLRAYPSVAEELRHAA
jgi:hypothetical protein